MREDVDLVPAEVVVPPLRRENPIRAAVVCDLREERWPSMDLVGDMLCRHLSGDCAAEVAVTQLKPTLKRRFEHVPLLPGKLARNGDRWLNRFVDYPSWLRHQANNYDVFHIVDHSYSQLVHAVPAKLAVVTCHDLDTFRCLLEPQLEPRPGWFRAMVRRILDGFLSAAHVIAVSGVTRDSLLSHGLFPPERISVIWNGVHPSCSNLPDSRSDARAMELMPKSNEDCVWLLSVGSTIPRKRLDVLLRVFAEVHRSLPQLRLVRVGGLTAEQRQLAVDLKIEEAMISLPFLGSDTLAAVYRRSNLLLHTADAEGFGLPIIEAMACGCAVVASDIPVLREVGGTAAIYCPVGDIGAWAKTVADLIGQATEHTEAWEERRRQGLNRARRFSWAENARQTALIYHQILEGSK